MSDIFGRQADKSASGASAGERPVIGHRAGERRRRGAGKGGNGPQVWRGDLTFRGIACAVLG